MKAKKSTRIYDVKSKFARTESNERKMQTKRCLSIQLNSLGKAYPAKYKIKEQKKTKFVYMVRRK